MASYTLKKLQSLPHIGSYSLTSLITDLGLYQPVIIDTAFLEKYICDSVPYSFEGYKSGKDFEVWHALYFSTDTFMLPCVHCENDQPYSPRTKYHSVYKNILSNEGTYPSIIFDNGKRRAFEKSEDDWIEERIRCENECKELVLREKYFSRTYSCSLQPNHDVYVSFKVEEVNLVEQVEDAESAKVKGYVILTKIGQSPSMADMQFFESNKYKRLLKDHYRDYTMALGLYASGVGCGSFLYLRRILEYLVEALHLECKQDAEWDEQNYQSLDFNDKIKEIEKTDRIIIPEELQPIRSKIYGVLSAGVHKSSESECKELFPWVKLAVDMIMDAMLAKIERAEKVKKMQQKFHSI